MSDNKRNATLKALIDAAITELLVKTSGEQIYLDDNTTLSSKMAEMVAAINLRDKKTDVDAKIKTVTDSLNSTSESLGNDISGLNTKVSTLENVKATKEELKAGLDTKSNVGHIHDDRYYTETEIDTKVKAVNDSISALDTSKATKEELKSGLATKSDTTHLHDDRYYTETEMDTKVNTINKSINTLESTKATKDELKTGLATKSNVGHTHDDRYYTETEMDTKISTINDAINLRPTQTAITEQLNTYAGTVDKKFSDVSTQIKTHTDAADKKFTTIDNTLATKADKTAVAEIKAVTDGLGNLATKNEVSKDDLDTALQTELDAKATTTAVNTKVSTLESSMNTKFSDTDKAINLRPTQTAVTEQIAALKQEIMGDLPAEAYDTFTELATYINEHQEAADALTAAVGDKADKSVVDDILTVINGLGTLAKKDKVAKADLDTALQTELNAKATKTYVDEQVSAIDTSLSGKSDDGHTHDDRYYTETEIDTKLKTKSDTSHTHDDRYYTETEVDTKLKTKSDTSHVHSAATTSANGFMSAADKTKLDGIDASANKTVVDSAMSSTSTNPVQNKVVQTALDAKSDTGHTHAAATTSANGFMSAADKAKLDGIASGANNITIDSALSSSSTNPVQNKVINTALAGKATSGHTHDDRYYTETEVDTKLKTKSDTSHTHDLSTMINVLTIGTDTPLDADYYIAQYAGGGTTHTTYHRRSISTLWSYIKSKADKVYAALSHKHTKADITDFPTSMPASDVPTWAKAATKPTYTKSDVGLGNVGNYKAVSTVANQGLTDTEKANARSNIGAGASSFSGNYKDLSNKPTLGTAAAKNVGDFAGITALTNQDLNNVTDPGFYNAGGSNTVTNKPSGVDEFGLIVTHNANGAYYTQVLYYSRNSSSYRRYCANGTWGSWVQEKLTDTTYSDATTSAHGLMTAAMVTKLNGIASGANKTTVDSALSATSTNPVQNKVIKSALDGKSDSSHTHGAASTSVNGFMTAAMVTKLNGITSGANKTTVDSALSATSTNPVQNKVINTALAGKAASSHTHDDRYYTESEIDKKLANVSAGVPISQAEYNDLSEAEKNSETTYYIYDADTTPNASTIPFESSNYTAKNVGAALNEIKSYVGEGYKLQPITQAAYDALTTIDPKTFYFITD